MSEDALIIDDDDDEIVFAPEDDRETVDAGGATWKILVVDDEPDVHKLTELALADFAFEDRRLLLLSAYSAREAAEAIAEHPDTAVILLDVVMETDDAGLMFVRHVRGEVGNHLVRIILRTGQPGVAPERRILLDYDINDYKNKAELTAQRLFTAMVSSLRSYRDLHHIAQFNQALRRFVPEELTSLLGKRSIVDVHLGDHIESEMAVLFSDLRSFTALSEQLTPADAFRFVNAYLEEVGPLIRDHHGWIDKYMGDALLAIFPGGADDALGAAVALQRKVDEINARRAGTDDAPIRIGVGVHAGPLVLGVIGEEERMEGTVIADSVNLAARLQGLCKDLEVRIVTTEACLAATTDRSAYTTRPLGLVPLRGKAEGVPAFELVDA